MTQDDLFGGPVEGGAPAPDSGPEPVPGPDAPLAARMRPRTLDELKGQRALLGPGGSLRGRIESGRISSMILWGPPGCGKTTLARLLAGYVDAAFEPISAVTAGVAAIREVTARARTRLETSGRRTIVFCDEIHRFNKGQQDAFLPHVESGTITLIGATTENPSFEVVRPLLSRAPIVLLEPLDAADVREILTDALHDAERGLGGQGLEADEDALATLAAAADGDARRALGALEVAAELARTRGGRIDAAAATDALQHRFAVYDKGGEERYTLISALHKSIRGGDADAALYWLARMLEGGEEPLYLARRLVRIASEDVGLAAPQALGITLAAERAYRFLGSPEGELALAEAVVFLAAAPKSNAVYVAFGRAKELAQETPGLGVPLHLRNAPTREMKALGYGEGYRYDPDEPGGVAAQSYLPDALVGRRLYAPLERGQEAGVRERLESFRRLREAGAAEEPSP
ncbi:MAG: replication-associated recombination protein A [Gemmatimonadota bacterium]